jgi:hypothetical protein
VPGTVELFADYWLCRPWCDRLGREAMKLSQGWSGPLLAARLAVLGAVATADPTRNPPCRIRRGVPVDRRGCKGVVLYPGAPYLPPALWALATAKRDRYSFVAPIVAEQQRSP